MSVINCFTEHLGDNFKKKLEDEDIPTDISDTIIEKIKKGENINKEVDDIFNKKKQAQIDILTKSNDLYNTIINSAGIKASDISDLTKGSNNQKNKAIKKISNAIKKRIDEISHAVHGEGLAKENAIVDNFFDIKGTNLDQEEMGEIFQTLFLKKKNIDQISPNYGQLDRDIYAVYNEVIKNKSAGTSMLPDALLNVTDNEYAHHLGTKLAESKYEADLQKPRANSGQYTGHLSYEQVKAGIVSEKQFVAEVEKRADWEHPSVRNKFSGIPEFVKEKKGLERQYQDKYNEYKIELDGVTNELLNQKEQLVSSLGDLEKDSNLDNIATYDKIKNIFKKPKSKNTLSQKEIEKRIQDLDKQIQDNNIKNKELLHNYQKRNIVSMDSDLLQIEKKYRKEYIGTRYKAIMDDFTDTLQQKKKWDFENNAREEIVDDDIQRSFVWRSLDDAYDFHQLVGNKNSVASNIMGGIVSQHKTNMRRVYFGDNAISAVEKMFTHFGDKVDANTFKISTDGTLFTNKHTTFVETIKDGPQLGDSLNELFRAYEGSGGGTTSSNQILSNLADIGTNLASFSFLKHYVVKSISDHVIMQRNRYYSGAINKPEMYAGIAVNLAKFTMLATKDLALTAGEFATSKINKNLSESLAAKTSRGKLKKNHLLNLASQTSMIDKMTNVTRETFFGTVKDVAEESASVIEKAKSAALNTTNKAVAGLKAVSQVLNIGATHGRLQKLDIATKTIMATENVNKFVSELVLGIRNNKFTQILEKQHGWTLEKTKKMLTNYGFDENPFDISKFTAFHADDMFKKKSALAEVEKKMKSLNDDIYKARDHHNKILDLQTDLSRETDTTKAESIKKQIDEMIKELKPMEEITKMGTDLQQIKSDYDVAKSNFDDHIKEGANVKSLYHSEIAKTLTEPGNSVKGALTRGKKPGSVESKFQGALSQFMSYSFQLLENNRANKAIIEETGGGSAALRTAATMFLTYGLFEALGQDLSNRIYNLDIPDGKKKRTVINSGTTPKEYAEILTHAYLRSVSHPTLNAVFSGAINMAGLSNQNSSNQSPSASVLNSAYRTVGKIRKGQGSEALQDTAQGTAQNLNPLLYQVVASSFKE